MKIIIPMAGQSRRFFAAGYTVPKPFLPIDGRPMIHHVCDMFEDTDEVVFICDRAHLEVPAFQKILDSAPHKHSVVGVEPPPEGPVATLLLLEGKLDPSDEVLVSYCDFTVRWDRRLFKRKAADYDGAIPCFRGVHPASFGNTYYAYARVNEDLELLELREKRSFTDQRHQEFASAGLYYFNRWDLVLQYGPRALRSFREVLPECYASLLYPHMLADGRRILVTEVEKFICWGTPQDLEQYQFWSRYFGAHANQLLKHV